VALIFLRPAQGRRLRGRARARDGPVARGDGDGRHRSPRARARAPTVRPALRDVPTIAIKVIRALGERLPPEGA